MKLNISIKILVLLQGTLVIGSLFSAIFSGIGTEHILPLNLVLWIGTCLAVFKSEKQRNNYIHNQSATVE
jgi:hypothetical protein